MKYKLITGDNLDEMRRMPPRCVDLVVCSPPYEDARAYPPLNFSLKGAEWCSWLFDRTQEMVRVCRGLVVVVVADKTENYEWSASVPIYITSLKLSGLTLRRPPLYTRHGIPGSGGPDWFKNMYETCVCITNAPGPLPWAHNTAAGHAPVCAPGGNPSHRGRTGARAGAKTQTRRKPDGSRPRDGLYIPPKVANPGNLIDCGANTHFGMGNAGDAPYPEKVPDFFIRSCCPPGGTVLDPFCGTGTTGVVCAKLGRNFIGIDIRPSEIATSRKRIEAARANPGMGL